MHALHRIRRGLTTGRIGLALLVALLPGQIRASVGNSSPARFTLEECLEIGLRDASARAEALIDERIAETRIGQIRAQALPHLRATGSYTRLDELTRFDTPEGSLELGRLDNFNLAAEVSQLLYAGGSVRSALSAAHRFRALSRAGTRQVEQALRLQIRSGFYGLLLARRHIDVREASLAQVRDMAAQAEHRFQAGTGSEFDHLAARVRVANEQPLLLAAQREYRLALAAFRDAVRLPVETFEPDGELAWNPVRVDEERLRILAFERRPEIEMMDLRLDLLRADLRAEQGGFLPRVNARASYGGSNPASFASAEDRWEWGWEAGIVMQWAVFDGALTRSRVQEKREELGKGRLAHEDLRRAVALEVEQALLDLHFADQAVEASRETVTLAERGLAIARSRFETGMATRLEYTDAQLALNTARLAWAQALRDHGVAAARLAHAAGITVEELAAGDRP